MSNELRGGIENAEVLNNSKERDNDGAATAACNRKLSKFKKRNNSWCRLIIEISFLS